MHEIDESEVTKTQRRLAKPDTFKPVYGGTKGTPAQEKYYKAFQEKYNVMHSAQLDWCELVANDKELTTAWGMKYYWPNAKRNRNDYLNVKTQVFNYPIQAFATAEVVPVGLTMFWHRIRDAEMFLINTVHDSVECELPEKEIELFAQVAVKALVEDVYRYISQVYDMKIDIPLGIGIVMGHHWSKPDHACSLVVEKALVQSGYSPTNDDGEVAVNVTPNEDSYV